MTPKQERFVHEYLKDLNATQAAIRSGYSERTARSIAAENLTKPDIIAAISKAQTKVANRAQISLETHLEKLAELRDGALADGKWTAAVAAEISRGKCVGLYVERHEHEIHDLTHEEREERIRSILLTAKQRKMGQLPA